VLSSIIKVFESSGSRLVEAGFSTEIELLLSRLAVVSEIENHEIGVKIES
jgi:hypothetical protein